jgi:glycosyltransferase involved in cell wall biosynthesis
MEMTGYAFLMELRHRVWRWNLRIEELHKGFIELIEAFCLVRDIYPDSKLVAMTALYPSEESESYLSECASLLSQKGLDHDDGVKFDSGFHEIEDVLDQLQVCDLLVLPYHPTDEGASGSVNVAMALRKPVITTSASVFRDTVGYTYRTEGADPLAIAIAVCNVVSNPDIYEELEAAAARYADERNWKNVAGAYESIVRVIRPPQQSEGG